MKTRPLGTSGITVSQVGAGLWGMGAWTGSSDDEARRSLQLSCDSGCNFFDSAWAYGQGKADTLLGELAAANRGKGLVLASKVPPKNMKWPTSPADSIDEVFPVDHVLEYTQRIRDTMKVGRIDVLQYHGWEDAWTDSPTFARAVTELKSRGLIRAFGISVNRLQPNNGLRALRTGLVDCVQVVYNIFDQAAADQMLPLCAELKIGVIARVPLDEGSLGGKFTADTRFPPEDWRAKYFNADHLRETLRRVEAIRADLPQGLPLPDAAMRFVISHPAVSTVIVGMRKESHVRANIAACHAGPLPAEVLARLAAHRWDR